ncbi:MAG: extracellular solute-binding protein [Candidatus Caldatribacteriota bacterium]|nr:extracellular solute-binding protein [Atribacterota bacterium]MDD3641312.1 extracellular solute-binding protein [Atribacterota bacterium]MDD4764751.1 extracellular solute-binding protein [Atribacterota bacterium]
MRKNISIKVLTVLILVGSLCFSLSALAQNEPVTISWWHIQTETEHRELWQDLADEYMAENPNVNIEITVMENENFKAKMTTVMQSGEVPDLFQSWGGGTMNDQAEAGLLKDITEYLDKDGWRETFSEGALGVYAYKGRNYGVPRDMGMVGFWYNKELFARAGIDSPPETWSELFDAIQKLKDADIIPIALGEGDKWTGAFYWEYLAARIGGEEAFVKAATREGSFTDPAFIEAGEKLLELVDAEPFQFGFLGATWADEATLMGNSEAAMDLMGQWAPGSFKENSIDGLGLGDKVGWFKFPMVEGGAGHADDALGGGNGFVVGKDAPEEAIDFLRFISSVESQIEQAKIGLSVPVVKGAEAGLTDPTLKLVQQGAADAKYFQLYYDQYLPPATGSVVNDAVQGLFAGTMTPEETAQMVEDSADREIK